MAYTPKNANGQATMANSSPVVVASDQTKIKVDLTETTANSVAIKVDGSAVTQPISAVSLPLPSTAATSTKQSDGSQKTQVVDGSGNVIGATSNALDINIKSGNPTTIAATQSGAWNVGLNAGTNAIGKLAANSGVDIGDVDVTSLPALAAGTNVIGKVGIDQTTNGTTNNVTNRDVTYNKFVSSSGTLVANTAATASLTVSGLTAVELEITNISGASTIYYTLDNSTPSSTNFSGILPATPSSVVLPCSGTPTLKLISAGTPTWGAVVRGV
jgi:hypothetical protein